MTHEDQVLELFGRANPIPDPDAFGARADGPVRLSTLDRRSEQMTGVTTRTKEVQKTKRRSGWTFAAAAVLVGVVAIGAFVLLGDARDDAAGGTNSEGAAEVAAVTAALQARSDGDIDAWFAAIAGEELEGALPWRTAIDAEVAAGQQFAMLEPCSYAGVSGEVTLVQCTLRITDDISGPGGVFLNGTSTFHVDLDLKIVQWDDGLTSNDPGDFEQSFLAWMRLAHPGVTNQLSFLVNDQWFARTPADVELLLPYVDEFIEQSTEYPIPNS